MHVPTEERPGKEHETTSMSLGVVKVDTAAAAAELNCECKEGRPLGNNVIEGVQGGADVSGRKDAQAILVKWFSGVTTESSRNCICNSEPAARNTSARNTTVSGNTHLSENHRMMYGGLEDGSENCWDFSACGSSPASSSRADRDADDNSPLGNIHATLRSDLLITHGISDKDTLYLIKREETRESEDFWVKIDRAKKKGRCRSLTERGEEFRTDAGCVKEKAREELHSIGEENEAQTSTSLNDGQNQALPWRHDKAVKTSAPSRRELLEMFVPTDLPEVPSGKESLSESRSRVYTSDSAVPGLDEIKSLRQRALQLPRDVRKNGSQDKRGGRGKKAEQERPQNDEEKLPHVGKRKEDARPGGAVYPRGDMRLESDFSPLLPSTSTEEDLRNHLHGQHAGTERKGFRPVHRPALVRDIPLEELPVKSTVRSHCVHLSSVTKEDSELRHTGSAPLLIALAARRGSEMQADSAELRKRSVQPTGEPKDGQSPQVIITASGINEAPVHLEIPGHTNKRKLQRPEDAHTAGMMPSSPLAAEHSQTQQEILAKHEPVGENTHEDQKREIFLEVGSQGQRKLTGPEEERRPRSQQHKEVVQEEAEVERDTELSSTWQEVVAFRLEQNAHTRFSSPNSPPMHLHEQGNQQQWAECEKEEVLINLTANSSQAEIVGGKREVSGVKLRIEENLIARQGLAERCADAHQLAADPAQLHSFVRDANRHTINEGEEAEGRSVLGTSNSKGRRKSPCSDRWPSCSHAFEIRSAREEREPTNLLQTRILTQSSDYIGVDQRNGGEVDKQKMDDFRSAGSSTQPSRFSERFPCIEGMTPIDVYRDGTMKISQTREDGGPLTPVRPWRMPLQTQAGTDRSSVHAVNQLRYANGSQMPECPEYMPLFARERRGEEMTRVSKTDGSRELKGCALKNILQEQQLEETWLLRKVIEQGGGNEQAGVGTKARSAQGTRSEISREDDIMTPLSIDRWSPDSKPRRIQSESQVRKLAPTLQRLQKIGNRIELCGNRRNKSSAEMSGRQKKRLEHQSKGTKEQKAVSVKRWASGSRPPRLQRLGSWREQAKSDSDVRRLLLKTVRGDGYCADELTDPWLDYRSSGESSYPKKKNCCEQKVEKRSRAALHEISADVPTASQMLIEEERTSQSSSGTSRGWVNLENDDLQDPDEEQCFLNGVQPLDDRERLFLNRECLAKPPSSGDVAAAGEAKSDFPAAALSPPEPPMAVGGRRDTVPSGLKRHSSSMPKEDMSSNMQKGVSSMSSHPCTRRSEAILQTRGDFVERRQTILVGTSTCGRYHDDCAVSNGRKAERDEGCMVGHSVYGDVGNIAEKRPGGRQSGPSSSNIISSRVVWETLDREAAFPMSQTRERAAPGVRLLEGESRKTEKHGFPFFLRRALGKSEAVHKDTGAVPPEAEAEDRQMEGKQNRVDVGAGLWKGAAAKEVSCKERKEGDGAQQEEASRRKNPGDSVTRDEDTHTEKEDAVFISSPSRMPQRNNISFLGLFGTPVGRWSFLNAGWKAQEDREKTKDPIGEDWSGEKGIHSSEDSLICEDSAASMNHFSPEVHGRHPSRRESFGNDNRILKRCGKRLSTASRRQGTRSNSTRGFRVWAAISKDRPGGTSGQEIKRSGMRINSARNNSRRRPHVCGYSVTPAFSGSVGCRGDTKGSTSRRSISNSMFHSTSGNVCRSINSERHQTASDGYYASSTAGVEDTHRTGVDERCVDLHMALNQSSIISTADVLRRRWLQANVHTLEEFLQPHAASLHPFLTRSHSSRKERRPAGKSRAKHNRRGVTASRRSMNRFALNKSLPRPTLSDWHCREGRLPLKRLDKELGCKEFSARGEGFAEKQAAIRMLHLRTHDNYGTPGPARTPFKESRHIKCSRVASLDSDSSIRVRTSTSACTDSSESSNNTSGVLPGRPSWTLFGTSAALAEQLTCQSSSSALRGVPVVSPLSPAAAHLCSTATYCPASERHFLSASIPFPISAAVDTPLFASGAQTAKFKSPVYVSENAAVCRSRLPGSAVSAVAPAGGGGVAHMQSSGALTGELADTGVLFAQRFPRSSTRNGYRDAGTCPTAASTLPFWRRWPAAVLRVVGLPLRCVVRVLGLNVSGAFDCWRDKIRQRSLRGFFTLCLLDGVVCAAAVWGVCHVTVLASRAVFRAAYLHVHSIDTEKASHYFDGLTYRFWGKRPLYFTDNPFVGAGRAADAEIATDPWSGLHQLQQRGIAWYQHHMYGNL